MKRAVTVPSGAIVTVFGTLPWVALPVHWPS